MPCFFIGRDLVGRKICIRTGLSPPPVPSEPTLRRSCHVGRSGGLGPVRSAKLGRRSGNVGVRLMVGLQGVSLSVGGYGMASVQLWP